jgi:hypothetical protein
MTTTTRQAYRAVLVKVFVLIFSIGAFAESRPAAVSTSPSSVARDLNATLAELMRVTPATSQDLTKLQRQGGRLHWVTFWQDDKAQKGKMTAALQRNLQFAVPDLVHDAQASGGSLSTTFKLYRDLTAVCESLDSMLPPGAREGKAELTALSNDLSAMNRLRDELSAYIQRTAVSMDREDARLVSSARSPKKVIVDDNVPEKPLPRKRGSSNQ